jgi:hypothetical protein
VNQIRPMPAGKISDSNVIVVVDLRAIGIAPVPS